MAELRFYRTILPQYPDFKQMCSNSYSIDLSILNLTAEIWIQPFPIIWTSKGNCHYCYSKDSLLSEEEKETKRKSLEREKVDEEGKKDESSSSSSEEDDDASDSESEIDAGKLNGGWSVNLLGGHVMQV